MSKPSFAFSKPLAAQFGDKPCAVLAYAEQGDAEWLLIVNHEGHMVWVPMGQVVIRDPETTFA